MHPNPLSYCPIYAEEISSPLEKLTLRLDTLPTDALFIHGTLNWQNTELVTHIHVQKTYGKLHIVAHCTGKIPTTCSRTLQPFMRQINLIEQERLCPKEDADLFENGLINIAEWVRQQLELNRPISPLHPSIVKGEVASFTAQESFTEEDSPFYALQALKVA